MKTTVILMSLLFLLLNCPVYGQKGKPKATPSSALEVRDSLGNKIGDVIAITDRPLVPEVVLQVGTIVFGLQILGSWPWYHGSQDATIYFSTSNCSGTPFLRFDNINERQLLEAATVRPRVGRQSCDGVCEELTVYIRKPGALTLQFNDLSGSWFGTGNYTCESARFSGQFVEALPLVDLDTYFRPPFTVSYLGTPLQ